MAKLYRELADIIEEMIKLDDQPEVSDEQEEKLLGRLLLKTMEIQKLNSIF